MVGAHQNRMVHVTSLCPFQVWFTIRGLALATINLPVKFEDSNSTHNDNMKGDTKYRNRGGLG